jgi:hypothetical protein
MLVSAHRLRLGPAELPLRLCHRIVIMEARAKPRLTDIDGLWRKGCKARPGSITGYIRGLLPTKEIDRLVAHVPTPIVAYQGAFALGGKKFPPGISSLFPEPERFSLPVIL